MHVRHDADQQIFTVSLDGHNGELTYARPEDGLIDFQHTWVDTALRGRGVAETLAEAGLSYAKVEGLKIRTTCPFMTIYIRRHPEWEALRET